LKVGGRGGRDGTRTEKLVKKKEHQTTRIIQEERLPLTKSQPINKKKCGQRKQKNELQTVSPTEFS